MCSVAGLDRNTVDRLCKEAKEADTATKNPVCPGLNLYKKGLERLRLAPFASVCGGLWP